MQDDFYDVTIDTRPWPELQEWQLGKMPAFVASLAQRSPFYARTLEGVDFARLTNPEAWAAIPFTSKEDLRVAQQSAMSSSRLGDLQGVHDDDLVQVLGSSGTTGLPVYFGLTRNDRAAWAHSVADMWFTAGIRRGSTVALTTGMPMVAGGMPFADGIRELGANLVWLGGQTPQRMASTIDQLKVDVLIGTASFVTFFASRCEQLLGRPATTLSVRTVIGGGEPGTGQPEIRAQMKAAWGASRVSEIMGICDVMAGLWGECPAGHGMHFTGGANVFVELIDPETGARVPWQAGALGEAVYTTFTREATPVLRFRSRDHMHVVDTECTCGRASPVVRCVGRTDDMLIYKAMNVFPSAIRDVVLQASAPIPIGPLRVRKESTAQVRFDTPIPVEVEAGSVPVPDGLGKLIEDAVQERLRVRVAVEFLSPGSIKVGEYKNALTYVGEPG